MEKLHNATGVVVFDANAPKEPEPVVEEKQVRSWFTDTEHQEEKRRDGMDIINKLKD